MSATAITMDSVVRASQDQVSCDMAGEAAILDLKSGQYYGLNPIGARIWNIIQEPKSVREVLGVLLNEYDVDAARCENDLLALVEELCSKGLATLQPAASE